MGTGTSSSTVAVGNHTHNYAGSSISYDNTTSGLTATNVQDALDELNSSLIQISGSHNSIYRGKFLGNAYTSEQKAEVTSGRFNDLYIGDYWTIDGNDYVIVHFDYFYRCSNSDVNYHHLIVMPRGNLKGLSFSEITTSRGTESPANGTAAWNSTDSTANGYIGSRMRTVVMPACDTKVKAAFGSNNVHAISELYPNTFASSTDGRATSWGWTSTDLVCDLCNETMVYGHQVWGKGSAFDKEGYEVGIDKWQLAIFRLDPGFANIRAYWWLRSVTSATGAAFVYRTGDAAYADASGVFGVRPRFIVS